MHCQNLFCIYWSDNKCSLSEIALDINGCCENCIYININETHLEFYRKIHLEKLKH